MMEGGRNYTALVHKKRKVFWIALKNFQNFQWYRSKKELLQWYIGKKALSFLGERKKLWCHQLAGPGGGVWGQGLRNHACQPCYITFSSSSSSLRKRFNDKRISMKFIYELQLGAQSFERALLKHTPNGHLLALN